MTLCDYADAINLRLQNSGYARFSKSQVALAINEAQLKIAKDTNLYEIRSNFEPTSELLHNISLLRIKKLNKIPIVSLSYLDKKYPGWETNTPASGESYSCASLIANKLILVPRLENPVTVVLTGTARPEWFTDIDCTKSLPISDLDSNLVILYASYILLSSNGTDEDFTKAMQFLAIYEKEAKLASRIINGETDARYV